MWTKGGEVIQGHYSIVYADPPWSYIKQGRGAAANHYRTMELDAMQKLPVASLCAPNCALFMWGTYPNIEHMIPLGRAWGFEYKTIAFQWIKTYANGVPFWGLGSWTRANSEGCFLFVKGKPKRLSASVHQVIYSPVRRHSEKPPEVRDRIRELLGPLPAIELFARSTVQGWDCWGSETLSGFLSHF